MALCSACAEDDPSVTGPEVDELDDFRAACGALAEVWCSSAALCLEATFAAEYGATTACVARRRELCERTKLGQGSRADAPRVRACAAALRPEQSKSVDQNCTDWLGAEVARTLPADCAPAGLLDDGAICLDAGQCASGACLRLESPRATCGVCGPPVVLGGACGSDVDCEPNRACVAGSCAEYGGLGEDCGHAAPCSPELACVAGGCIARIPKGGSCEPGQGACRLWEEQLACDPVSATCQPIATGLPEGAVCADDPAFVPQEGPCFWGTLPAQYCQAGVAAESLCGHGLGCEVLLGKGTCRVVLDDEDACSVTNPSVSYVVGPCTAPAECLDGRCQIPDTGACGKVPP
jgi:hypothetical protein